MEIGNTGTFFPGRAHGAALALFAQLEKAVRRIEGKNADVGQTPKVLKRKPDAVWNSLLAEEYPEALH